MEFISHRGAEAGEPNAHEVIGPSARVLLDCGAGGRGPDYVDALTRPDAVWISHAHRDHCGAVLKLLSRWPRLPVMATEATKKLLRFALRTSGDNPANEARIEAVCRRIAVVPWRRFRAVPGADGAQIMALPAGHVPGAAMAVVQFDDPQSGHQRAVYTGDFCTHDQLVVSGAGIPGPDGQFPIDVVISEAMLANDREADEVDWDDEARRLVEAVQNANGAVLAGVASIGESAVVAALLARAGVEVMVDEYLRPALEVSRAQFGDHWKRLSFGDRRRLRGRLRAGAVVVAPGDQYRRNTAAAALADPLVDDPSATLVVLNRARKKTGAGRLVATDSGDSIQWQGRSAVRRARVVYRRLLNHAPRWQLMGFIQGVDAPKTLLVHGPTGSRWGLKRALAKRGYTGAVEVVRSGERYAHNSH